LAIEEQMPDLVVLDLICRYQRLRGLEAALVPPPVIMLTAQEEIDRVLDWRWRRHYLAKPFSSRAAGAHLRHPAPGGLDRQVMQPQVHALTLRQLSLDLSARRVFMGEQELQLSAREFDLLAILMKSAGRAMSREELIDQVWGEDWTGDARTLDVHVRWLRLKIEEDPASPQYIQTVRGFGYRFAGPEELT
jgi:two-component system OmpR family response regulator/two-component system alkaline phosphatase synthesis response regulator PhoP